MQKHWLPFRKLESLDQQQSRVTGATERIKFRSNDKDKGVTFAPRSDWKIVNDRSEAFRNERPQTSTSSKSENVIQSNGLGTAVRDNRTNQNGLSNDRKRRSNEAEAEEPPRKKNLPNNDGFISTSTMKNAQAMGEAVTNTKQEDPHALKLTEQRCLTGDVGQILKLNKQFPSSNAFYEVYANVFKIDSSRDRQKVLLLRNSSGPVVQGIFNEIDVKIDVKQGDAVICVGKFINNSRLHLFKVSLRIDSNKQLVSRLYSLANFSLTLSNNANNPKTSNVK